MSKEIKETTGIKDKIPWDDWLAQRKTLTNDSSIRAQAFFDHEKKEERKEKWDWISLAFRELNQVYFTFGWVDEWRRNSDKEVLETISKNQKNLDSFKKTLLGLDQSATEKDVEERARIFGILVNRYVKEHEEDEEKQKQLKAKILGNNDKTKR